MHLIHAYVLLFDRFADHEIALVLTELNAREDVILTFCGMKQTHVSAISGLRVLPGISCEDIDPALADLFILPGGALWEHPDRNHPFDPITARVFDMFESFIRARVPIAFIGSATAAAARAGLLDDRHHAAMTETQFRHLAPAYSGDPFSVPSPAVNDGGIITASSTGHVEFAFEILVQLGLCAAEHRSAWLARYQRNSARLVHVV